MSNIPSLFPAATPSFSTINEDAGAPSSTVGSLVSELIDSSGSLNNYSDVDGDDPGIAIVGVNTDHGTLYKSIDNGGSWTPISSASASSAITLLADHQTRLAFEPSTDFFGSISDIITFKAWDRTEGYSNGSTGISTIAEEVTSFDEFNNGQAHDVVLSPDNTKAYVASGSNGLKIVSISDPNNPSLIATIDTPGYANGVILSGDGNTAYVSDTTAGGLQIVNVSNPSSPSILGSYNSNYGSDWDTAISPDGNKAFIADSDQGLQIVDVSNPSNPTSIRSYTYASNWSKPSALGVAISPDGNTAYIAGQHDGLVVIDVSTPSSPSVLTKFSGGGNAYDITLSADGQTAYIADYDYALKIVNISDPSSPTLIGSYTSAGRTLGVTLSQDESIAYITKSTNYNGGKLELIDIRDPSNPSLISSHGSSGPSYNVAVSADDSTRMSPATQGAQGFSSSREAFRSTTTPHQSQSTQSTIPLMALTAPSI